METAGNEQNRMNGGEEGRGEKRRREGGREGGKEREGRRERGGGGRGGEGGGRECVQMCLTHKSSLMYTEINRISKLSMMTDSLQ